LFIGQDDRAGILGIDRQGCGDGIRAIDAVVDKHAPTDVSHCQAPFFARFHLAS
jgi:hypothetical protein